MSLIQALFLQILNAMWLLTSMISKNDVFLVLMVVFLALVATLVLNVDLNLLIIL